MKRCLGTPIETARDDDRPRTVLLSDLHITRAGGLPLEALATVLAGARERADETRVVVLGDLFDVYVSNAQLRMPRWDEVGRELRATTAAGVPVTVLHGNRDFLLGRGFTRATGCRVVPGGLLLRLGGKRVLCLHGDELCTRDLAYQRAKRVLRSLPVRTFARLLPARAVLGAGGRVREASSAAQAKGDPGRFDAAAEAVGRALAESGAEVLVFGHVHRAAHHPSWDGAGEVWILPAFDEAGLHLVHESGGFTVRSPGGEPAADFPPRPLP